MAAHAFCGRSPAASLAPTDLKDDSSDAAASRRREVLPVRLRCHRTLARAAHVGGKVRAMGVHWWLRRGVPRFESQGAPQH